VESRQRASSSLFILIFLCPALCVSLLCAPPPVTEERALFLREQSSKMYSPSAYFLSKMMIELPLNTVLSCVFGIIGYVMCALSRQPSDKNNPRALKDK
jgi:ABC-type multidrug transport system permease subunit